MGTQGTGKSFQGDLVLDAGALIAYQRGAPRARAIVKQGFVAGRVILPTSALAQTWRGGPRSAPLARLIEASEIDVLDEDRAKEIGVRLGARSASDVTDAHVVCCALARRAKIATSDPTDIQALAEAGEPVALISL